MAPNPVEKTIGGVTFTDRFAHLHEDSPAAVEWQFSRDRIAHAAAVASPNYEPVRQRLLSLAQKQVDFAPRKRGPFWFAYSDIDGDVVLRAGDRPIADGRIIVSTRELSAKCGGKATLMWFEPSPQGRFVAVAWGVNGGYFGPWSVFRAETSEHVLDTPHALFTSARPGWLPDESGFWLGERTPEGEHRLRFIPVAADAPQQPDAVLPEDLVDARYSGLTPHVSPDGRWAVLVTEPHEHVAVVLINLETLEARSFLPDGWSGDCDGTWIDNETYLARVNGDVPRGRVVAIPFATSRDATTWRELVPEGDGFMSWAGVVGPRVYVGDMVDLSLRVRVFDLDGRPIETLPLETPGSSPSMLVARALQGTDTLAFTHATFTRSPILVSHDPETNELVEVTQADHRMAGVTVDQRFATSKDGTRIPYFLVQREDVDPSHPQPTLVHAYGGFNVSLLPTFPANFVPFIEAGGVFVQASLRGGGEYGKAWHDAGRLENKQNTFDDLEAVAEALIAQGISTPAQMAFQGVSNGGLLAGAAIVQQPHLWRAVAPVVPVFDMMEALPLTPETAPYRAVFYEDYGDTAKPEEAALIIKWSPYHNIKDGQAYPAIFQVFGENDPGCMPFHGRKFTARIDEANVSDGPVHLRVWRDVGHAIFDPAEAASQTAEWLAFLMDQVGLKAVGATE